MSSAAAVRLTVSCQRRTSGLRCDGLGPWTEVLTFLAWLSIPINVGMIALATQQLDIYFDPPLPPFEKLLCAVVAEHVLLAAKFGVQFAMDADDVDDQASEAAEAQRRRYLRGVHGLSGADDFQGQNHRTLSPLRVRTGAEAPERQQQPRLASVFPSSGPCATGTVATIRGERLGLAIARGEVLLRLHLPRATTRSQRPRTGEPPASTLTLSATFLSDRKLTCFIPPCECIGFATIEVLHPDQDRPRGTPSKGGENATKPVSPKRGDAKEIAGRDEMSSAVAPLPCHEESGSSIGGLGMASLVCTPTASVSTPSGMGGVSASALGVSLPRGIPSVGTVPSRDCFPTADDGTCRFQYYGAFVAQRLRPSCGPLVGGTPVRVLGSGFVETHEITCCVRLGGVERCIPAAFVSETEVRFLTPSFTEVGDAKVTVALNGHDYDADAEPLCFQYHSAPLNCAVQ